MSLIPLLMDLAEEFNEEFYREPYDDDFAFGISPHEIHSRHHHHQLTHQQQYHHHQHHHQNQRNKIPRLHLLAAAYPSLGQRRHCPYTLCNNKKTTSSASSTSTSSSPPPPPPTSSSSVDLIQDGVTVENENSANIILKKENFNSTLKKNNNYSSTGKNGFQVCMDVKQFKPNELNVKIVENIIMIEGKHEEREDEHGLIARHFIRKYTLPKGYDPKEVISTLSSDGVLTVKAPPPPKLSEDGGNERIVQIQQTGPAHLTIKENPKEIIITAKEKEEVEKEQPKQPQQTTIENGDKLVTASNNEKMED